MYRLTFAVSLVALVGCSKTDSEDLKTSGIYASITARAEGAGQTRVTAELLIGNPINLNFVELSADDELIARHAGQSQTMTESQLLNIVSYSATFPTEASGESFEVGFERGPDDVSAPSSTASLPAPFTLAAPPATSSRAAALTLTWSPSATADQMSITIDGPCIDSANIPVTGDPGSVTIAAGTIKKKMVAQGETVEDSCQARLRIERSRAGQIDSHYGKGGDIHGVQSRMATFTTAL
ncbi:hypothetical protein BH11MYX3_BH11MYX3_23540 [soil metagenome]